MTETKKARRWRPSLDFLKMPAMSRRKGFGFTPKTLSPILALREQTENKVCADCRWGRQCNWASLTYAVFVCKKCAGRHRALGINMSFVRSLESKTWTDAEILRMRMGGNKRLKEYLKSQEERQKHSPSSRGRSQSSSSTSFMKLNLTKIKLANLNLSLNLNHNPIEKKYTSLTLQRYRSLLNSLCEAASPKAPRLQRARTEDILSKSPVAKQHVLSKSDRVKSREERPATIILGTNCKKNPISNGETSIAALETTQVEEPLDEKQSEAIDRRINKKKGKKRKSKKSNSGLMNGDGRNNSKGLHDTGLLLSRSPQNNGLPATIEAKRQQRCRRLTKGNKLLSYDGTGNLDSEKKELEGPCVCLLYDSTASQSKSLKRIQKLIDVHSLWHMNIDASSQNNRTIRSKLVCISTRVTYPQVFILHDSDFWFAGELDDLQTLANSDELDSMLESCRIVDLNGMHDKESHFKDSQDFTLTNEDKVSKNSEKDNTEESSKLEEKAKIEETSIEEWATFADE
mmetsp:Transcript_24298/g.36448  ORF Transcript_24298/g.36448 Transcript_24298/m.36448 type:complete len:515 (-) Transcript_24298:152-1696(-)